VNTKTGHTDRFVWCGGNGELGPRRWHIARRVRYSRVVAIVTLDIPDELSAALASVGRELSRSVFEALALEAYRERKLSTAQLTRLLGFESRHELDGFLKAREVARIRRRGSSARPGHAPQSGPLAIRYLFLIGASGTNPGWASGGRNHRDPPDSDPLL